MPTFYKYPGVYIEKTSYRAKTIECVDTSITAFIGRAKRGQVNEPIAVNSFAEYEEKFGGLWLDSTMSYAISDFFVNGGSKALIVRVSERSKREEFLLDFDESLIIGDEKSQTGLYALEKAHLFNILCIPPVSERIDISKNVVTAAAKYCEKSRAMLILDSPKDWTTSQKAISGMKAPRANLGTLSKNAAIFYPRIKKPNPLRNDRIETFVACGVIAGVIARNDSQQGIWKAAAGIKATLKGVTDLSVNIADEENAELNRLGCNCLRVFSHNAPVVWGSRTLEGNDSMSSEWKYIAVRRTALFIEESIYSTTRWAVFEINDESLWAKIRLNVGGVMLNLFKQGAFQGQTPKDAYFIKCDTETTTQNDVNNGVVNILIGFAPLKPSEFVIIKIQLKMGKD